MENKDYILDSLKGKVAVKRLRSDDDETLTVISKYETPEKKKSKISLENESPVTTLHQLEPNLKYEVSFNLVST